MCLWEQKQLHVLLIMQKRSDEAEWWGRGGGDKAVAFANFFRNKQANPDGNFHHGLSVVATDNV